MNSCSGKGPSKHISLTWVGGWNSDCTLEPSIEASNIPCFLLLEAQLSAGLFRTTLGYKQCSSDKGTKDRGAE